MENFGIHFMTHWVERYLGQPFSPDRDCFFYFRLIQKEVFQRDCLSLPINHDNLTLSAAKAMSKGQYDRYIETNSPREGDAVFLSQRTRPHHIGTMAVVGGISYVVHALDHVGVVLSDLTSLHLNGWKVAGYWTWK